MTESEENLNFLREWGKDCTASAWAVAEIERLNKIIELKEEQLRERVAILEAELRIAYKLPAAIDAAFDEKEAPEIERQRRILREIWKICLYSYKSYSIQQIRTLVEPFVEDAS